MNTSLSHEAGQRAVSVESFPVDESPYVVRGLGENSKDTCRLGVPAAALKAKAEVPLRVMGSPNA